MSIKVGCCGFPVKKSEYFAHFPVVEIQKTFYELPLASTALKWREEAPEPFAFTLKAWQLITHDPASPTYRRLKHPIPGAKMSRYGFFRPTDEVFEAWERTWEIAGILRAQLIVFQCPATFEPDSLNIKNLKMFFSTVERGGLVFGWEPRGAWSDSTIEELCSELDLIHITDPFQRKPVYGKLSYFRLHGIGGYHYRYTSSELVKLLNLLDLKREAYVMFNNTSMFENALEFMELVE